MSTLTTSTSLVEVDGSVSLEAALGAMQQGYAFESIVGLDGEVVTTVSGIAGREGIQAIVATGGAEVEYLLTADGRWIREPGEDWLAMAEEAPVADPLTPLAAYQSVEVVDHEGDRLLLRVSYRPATLGLEGEEMVQVEILLVDGVVSRVSYSSGAGESVAEVVTSFTEVGLSPPVTPPAG